MKQMKNNNEVVGMKNRVTMNGGWKLLVRPFKGQELWKCIGCIILAVTFGVKRHHTWVNTEAYVIKKGQTL